MDTSWSDLGDPEEVYQFTLDLDLCLLCALGVYTRTSYPFQCKMVDALKHDFLTFWARMLMLMLKTDSQKKQNEKNLIR